MNNVFDLLRHLKDVWGCAPNVDDLGRRPVSNKQLKRWLDSGAVLINGQKANSTDLLPDSILSVVFFPKKRKITIY